MCSPPGSGSVCRKPGGLAVPSVGTESGPTADLGARRWHLSRELCFSLEAVPEPVPLQTQTAARERGPWGPAGRLAEEGREGSLSGVNGHVVCSSVTQPRAEYSQSASHWNRDPEQRCHLRERLRAPCQSPPPAPAWER